METSDIMASSQVSNHVKCYEDGDMSNVTKHTTDLMAIDVTSHIRKTFSTMSNYST